MRRDQFSLHRRGGIWYVQFYNPHTHRYLTARSTGESNRNAALLKVAAWMRDGLPDPSRGSRQLRELLDLDLAISIIRSAPLTLDEAGRIVKALKDRGLIRDATVGAGPVSEPLITFLERFWDYEQSPYVSERVAHGQRISRRHCREASNRLEYYCKPYFGKDKALSEVRKSDINTFAVWMKQDKGLMGGTVNNRSYHSLYRRRLGQFNEVQVVVPRRVAEHNKKTDCTGASWIGNPVPRSFCMTKDSPVCTCRAVSPLSVPPTGSCGRATQTTASPSNATSSSAVIR